MWYTKFIKLQKGYIMRIETVKCIEENKLIVNMKGFSADMLLYSVEALIKGGIKAVEIPFVMGGDEATEREVLLKIGALKKCFGKDIKVGGGNVVSDRAVKLAKGAGADFISAPNVCREVLERANAVGVATIPGGYTSTEILAACSLEADFVTIYPTLSGPDQHYAKVMAETLPNVKLMAAGDIDFNDIAPLYKAGIRYYTISGSLANITLAQKQEYGIMEQEAKRYVDLLGKL